MKRLLSISLAIVLALGMSIVAIPVLPAVAAPDIIYVSTTGSDTTGDGSIGNPYQTISKGISMASGGDEVSVAAGTYNENITLKSGVIVQGAGAGVTTIDGGDSYSVVTANNVDSAAKLDGFTITGSISPLFAGIGIDNLWNSSPTISNNIITGKGAGISNSFASSPTITGNIITGNRYEGIANGFSSPTIIGNTITGNSDYGIYNTWYSSPTITGNIITGNGSWSDDAGIYNTRFSSPTITGNIITDNYLDGIYNEEFISPTISNNTITDNVRGIHNEAGSSPTITNNTITGNELGIKNEFSSPTISKNTINGNWEGIHNEEFSSPTISNNTITGNVEGIHNEFSSPTISNNTIAGNSDYGIYNEFSSPKIGNNTITGSAYGIRNSFASSPTISNNTITGNAEGIHNEFSSSPTVTNSILWDNGQEIYNFASTPVVTYSDIEGGYTGTGNIDADPLFVNPGAGDYHLQSGSPCIDVGSNTAVPSWLTTDFEGEPRICDGNGDGDAVVDMGADEYYAPVVPPPLLLLPATIDIDPDMLNLNSKGKWITAYIELPAGYDVYQIDISTVMLNGEVSAESDPKYGFVKDPESRIGDYDDDGIPDCMVKFDRSEVQAILTAGDAIEITLTGEVAGTPFEGSDIIRVK